MAKLRVGRMFGYFEPWLRFGVSERAESPGQQVWRGAGLWHPDPALGGGLDLLSVIVK